MSNERATKIETVQGVVRAPQRKAARKAARGAKWEATQEATVTTNQNASQVTARGVAHVISDYIAMTKPKHQAVLLTTWSTMTLAGGLSFGMTLYVLLATALAVASSHVFNQWLDRSFDARMTRTANRPLAAGRVSGFHAVVYGTALGVASVVMMVWKVNALSALLAVLGFFIYVVVYTWWLKPRSPWSTLGGGASGAMPTLIGWAAVTERIDVAPLLLFAFMLIWQSPHFYALSLYRGDDYARAGIPVVVVARGVAGTLQRMIWNTIAMVIPTLLLYPVGATGVGFFILALLTGGLYLAGVIVANKQGVDRAAYWGRRLFLGSYLYMATIYIGAVLFRTPVVVV